MQYRGDSETGLVHREGCACDAEAHELFLDVRTALVRGYRLCPVCAADPATNRRGVHTAASSRRA